MCMSTGVAAMKMPDRPPMMNIETNAMALSIAAVKWSRPPHIVPIQLKTFTADGRAIIIVESMNVAPRAGFMPDWNMWCPQTMNPSPAIPQMAKTIGLEPNRGLREKVEMTSETIPIAGRIMM